MTIQGVRLAVVLFGQLQNSEWAPFGTTFSIAVALWKVWEPNFETWFPGNGPFFLVGALFVGSKKHESLKIRKSFKKNPIDRPRKHVV